MDRDMLEGWVGVMVSRAGWIFDQTDVVALPVWAALAVAAFVVVGCALAFVRGWTDDRGAMMGRVAFVLLAALVGLVVIDQVVRRDLAGDRQALVARAQELNARATMPGSALACLDAMAGETVETFCEKALFATPQATAAAVSYVDAQLALLAAGNQQLRRGDRSHEDMLANLRRAAELDRFGIVAHVLSVRHGCTAEQCAAFAMLNDARRVSRNMTGHTYDAIVDRYAAAWPAAGSHPVAGNAPPAIAEAPAGAPLAGAPLAGAKLPNNLFLPSSSSIPAVSIMNAEPGASPHDTTGSTQAPTPTPPRKPQARPPGNSPTAARPAAPQSLAPSGQ
jgi:hypothetical protein